MTPRAVRRSPRYRIATIGLPAVLFAMSLVSIRITGQLAGREVHDGAITISGAMLGAAAIGWVASLAAMVAVTRNAAGRRLRHVAVMPLAATAATLTAVLFSGGLAPDTAAPEVFAIGVLGLQAGAFLGWLLGRAILDLDALDTLDSTDVAAVGVAPTDTTGARASDTGIRRWTQWPGVDRIGSDYSPGCEWQDPEWTGRTPLPYLPYLNLVVLPVLILATEAWWGISNGPRPLVIVVLIVSAALWIVGFLRRRIGVSIGPSGILLCSGLRNRPIVGVRADRIESVGVYTSPRSLVDRWWVFRSNRLTISSGRGPAILVGLSDGHEILLRIDDAVQAASEIERLIGSRGGSGQVDGRR